MKTPDNSIGLFGYTYECQTHERRCREVKLALPVCFEKRFETRCLLGCRKGAPIVLLERQFHSPLHNLKRLVYFFPEKRGAQYWMTLQNLLPGSDKSADIEVSLHDAAKLKAIHTRSRRIKTLKQHPLLHRRQFI